MQKIKQYKAYYELYHFFRKHILYVFQEASIRNEKITFSWFETELQSFSESKSYLNTTLHPTTYINEPCIDVEIKSDGYIEPIHFNIFINEEGLITKPFDFMFTINNLLCSFEKLYYLSLLETSHMDYEKNKEIYTDIIQEHGNRSFCNQLFFKLFDLIEETNKQPSLEQINEVINDYSHNNVVSFHKHVILKNLTEENIDISQLYSNIASFKSNSDYHIDCCFQIILSQIQPYGTPTIHQTYI